MLAVSRRGRAGLNVWPAFVDALASVLLVLVFMLLVFVLGQYLLSAKLTSRDRALDELGRQVSALADTLVLERASAAALRARLAATLAQLEERTGETEAASGNVSLLSQQVGALREQLERLNAALEASEAKSLAQQREIERLGERLNVALAKKAEELQRYRSEFFGRLRALLGEHPSIRVVGDRFVFQSELLFPSGEATLRPEGSQSLAQLAKTLKAVTRKIPPDIDWVLRIDGHTDRRPISTARFPSNWELSTARALSVVRFLAARGIAERHLSAAGFGEHHPIDPGTTDEAYARNRRIEIKLTPP
ncbi:MAG TPA: peptidoglycan -binding protein [Burkholderiales bacterium]